jgi:uncharacterized membrane protein required for colicin V production
MSFESLVFPFDYIILVLFIIIIIISTWKGLIQSILGLLTWVGSILITIYSYNVFSDFLIEQLLRVNFLQNNEYIISILSITISIPIIFIISIFVLKRIRTFLSSDLDKQVLGILFDKFFGILYGIIFSYAVLSSIIVILERFELERINAWVEKNSYIILNVKNFNNDYIYIKNKIDEIQE